MDIELLNKIIENAPVGILITDGDGKILLVNKRNAFLSGIDRKELIGKNIADMTGKGLLNESASIKVIKSKKPIIFEQTSNLGTQEEIDRIVQAFPVFDDNGNVQYVVNYLSDSYEKEVTLKKLKDVLFENEKYQIELKQIKNIEERNNVFVYRSNKMNQVLEKAQKVAEINSTVLITGESGTGKSMLAKYIHSFSDRSKNPFVDINCSAIPAELMESELFGYEQGAFTGAKKGGKVGMFECAEGGTLFLDEIGEMPVQLQAKLLSILQNGEFYKIGGNKLIKTDVRIIAATNADLSEKILQNEFRKDLYYRLNVISISIPPLRERPEDIAPLANHFIEEFNKKYDLQCKFSIDAIRVLEKMQFEGNIRELRNLIERTIIFSSENYVDACNLQFDNSRLKQNIYSEDSVGASLRAKEVREKKRYEEAAKYCRTTIEVAKYLGVSQSTASRKLNKFDIDLKYN